jgi:steroid 5-alpha reductase family enzyme
VGSVAWLPLALGLAAAAAAIVALMAVTMAISLRVNNWTVIDTTWGLGFVVIAVVSYLVSIGHGNEPRRLIALIVPVVWGVRLGGYIHWRNRGKPEDPRYTSLLKRRTGRLVPHVIRMIFWPQGWVMWVVAIPISVAMFESAPVNVVTWIGVALAAVGVFFEAGGDAQLARFKANPANDGKVMDRGLWSWTRHPNYFGDICVMFAFWLISCGSWIGVATIFAPILMARLLIARTGKPLVERRMARNRGPAYADYVARTSGIIPRPPRKQPEKGTLHAVKGEC